MSDTWKSGIFQTIATSVSSTVVQSGKCSFCYFLAPLCSTEHLFLWIDIQSRKSKRGYKLHLQNTKKSSNPYKRHGEITAAIPNQALQRHRGEQLVGELERCREARLGRMNFTSISPFTQPLHRPPITLAPCECRGLNFTQRVRKTNKHFIE